MITVRFAGGLANRMFQYAALYASGRRSGIQIAVPPWDGQSMLMAPRDPVPAAAPSRVLQEGDWQEHDPRLLNVADGTELVGFFQTEKYFCALRAEILSMYAPAPSTAAALSWFLGGSSRPLMVVHSREGDFAASDGIFPVMGQDYFRRAVDTAAAAAGRAIGDFDVVLASDNPSSRALEFLGPAGFRRSCLPPAADLHLLASAEACVLSPSSFSWWGAWLNPRSTAVVAPRHWINCFRPSYGWFPRDIEIPDWTYVDPGTSPLPVRVPERWLAPAGASAGRPRTLWAMQTIRDMRGPFVRGKPGDSRR